jgi:hypothetical protein
MASRPWWSADSAWHTEFLVGREKRAHAIKAIGDDQRPTIILPDQENGRERLALPDLVLLFFQSYAQTVAIGIAEARRMSFAAYSDTPAFFNRFTHRRASWV